MYYILRPYVLNSCTDSCYRLESVSKLLYFYIVLNIVLRVWRLYVNPYPTAFPYGNGMVLPFYQQQESSTTKTVHKVINKGLKTYV